VILVSWWILQKYGGKIYDNNVGLRFTVQEQISKHNQPCMLFSIGGYFMNSKTTTILLVFLLALPTQVFAANMTPLISYQGILKDTGGNLINGNVAVTFKLYNNSTAGSLLWEETKTILVNSGLFNTQLGDVTPLNAAQFDQAMWLEITIGADTLSPRQQLMGVPYAFSLAPGAVVNNSTHNHDGRYAKSSQTCAVGSVVTGVDAGGYLVCTDLSSTGDMEARLSKLENIFSGTNRTGNDIYFNGTNIHITSGSGATDGVVNGLGNLIIGYNEPRGGSDDRTGSHNLVLGSKNNYTSYGGLVAGAMNNILAPYASVSGGYGNTANESYSSVGGGISNIASGWYSSVSGGEGNRASGDISSVSGGGSNSASGYASSVSGGISNAASGYFSSISGGRINTASGYDSSSVSGGYNNTASGSYSSVSGGTDNTASGWYSSVSAGAGNIALNTYSSVSGGDWNTASGYASSVSGGSSNKANGTSSSVSGGISNAASGPVSSVSGGDYNTAIGFWSSVSGGFYNNASGPSSSVSGGGMRYVGGDYNWGAGALFQSS